MWRGIHGTWVCVPCRIVRKAPILDCTQCGNAVIYMGYRWRPPRKNNDAAWKRIEAGDWLWENPKRKASDSTVRWNGNRWVDFGVSRVRDGSPRVR